MFLQHQKFHLFVKIQPIKQASVSSIFFTGHVFHLLFHLTGIDDLFSVKRELQQVIARWKHIGLALRLDHSQLKQIEKENRDLDDCMTEMLTLWLNKSYNIGKFGEPSWELLAKAVGDPAGGNNPALGKIKNPQR